MVWIIQDWMSNHCYKEEKFNSFGEARDFISEVADDQATRDGGMDQTKCDEIYNGVCDDLYAIEVDKDGKKLESIEA